MGSAEFKPLHTNSIPTVLNIQIDATVTPESLTKPSWKAEIAIAREGNKKQQETRINCGYSAIPALQFEESCLQFLFKVYQHKSPTKLYSTTN